MHKRKEGQSQRKENEEKLENKEEVYMEEWVRLNSSGGAVKKFVSGVACNVSYFEAV